MKSRNMVRSHNEEASWKNVIIESDIQHLKLSSKSLFKKMKITFDFSLKIIYNSYY